MVAVVSKRVRRRKGSGEVVQWWNPCLGCLQPMLKCLGSGSGSVSHPASCWYTHWQAASDGSSGWIPATHISGALGAWLWLDTALIVVGIEKKIGRWKMFFILSFPLPLPFPLHFLLLSIPSHCLFVPFQISEAFFFYETSEWEIVHWEPLKSTCFLPFHS